MQAVTRQIMGIGQELTYARERVALLDDAPKSNGTIAPSTGEQQTPSIMSLTSTHGPQQILRHHCFAMHAYLSHQNACRELGLPCAK